MAARAAQTEALGQMTASDDVVALASVLADWAAGAPGFKIYLFGSRVRGDHRPDGDVDVSIEFVTIGDQEMQWWKTNNEVLFAVVNAKLPGPLQILEENDPITAAAIELRPLFDRKRHVMDVAVNLR